MRSNPQRWVFQVATTTFLLSGCLKYTDVVGAIDEVNARIADQQHAAAFLAADTFGSESLDAAADAEALNQAVAELSGAIEAVKDTPTAVAPLRLRLALLYLSANLIHSADNTVQLITTKEHLTSARDSALLAVWEPLKYLQDYRARKAAISTYPLCVQVSKEVNEIEFDPTTPENFCPIFMGARQTIIGELMSLRNQDLEQNREIVNYLNYLSGMIVWTAANERILDPNHYVIFVEEKIHNYLDFIPCSVFQDYSSFISNGSVAGGDLTDASFIGPVYRLHRVASSFRASLEQEVLGHPDEASQDSLDRARDLMKELDLSTKTSTAEPTPPTEPQRRTRVEARCAASA